MIPFPSTRNLLLITLMSLFMMSACHKPEHADRLFYNGTIYTVDDSFTVHTAMVVRDGKVLATGNDRDLRRRYHADLETDLNGRFVYPGLIDAHCHFLGYARSLHWAWLGGAADLEGMLRLVELHARGLAAGEWVLGRGWDHNEWPGTPLPVRRYLDEIFPDRPVMLIRTDGHAVAVNTLVLEMSGLLDARTDRGGEIMMEDGVPNGILLENTADQVKALVPPMGRESMISAILRAQQDCFGVGLTSVHDAGLSYASVMLVDSLQKAAELMMHVNAMLEPSPENLENFVYNGVYVTDKLSVRSVKLYADGALGSRGALLKEDYSDRPGYRGIAVTPFDSMRWVAGVAYEFGYQVCTHAIGDSANKLVLDIYASVLRERNDFRWRIEHAQVVDPLDRHLFRDFSIIPSVNTVHATSDMGWAASRLGEERMPGAYAYRDLLQENAWLCNGSDFPVESIDPLQGFRAAVARQDAEGRPDGGFQPANALDRESALRAMTIWAAKAGFYEKERGSLEAGKRADFVILDRDIMKVDTRLIDDTKVIETYVDGKMVYER